MKNPLDWLGEKLGITTPVREAVAPIGVTVDHDEDEWIPLSGDGRRDLTPMTQRRMQSIAAYLWESNLLANRLIELPIAYILADGIKLHAENEILQPVLDSFWNDPINCMNIKLVKKIRELSLFGEQCWPVFVNEYSGKVRLGCLDPSLIHTVIVDPDNGEQPIGIVSTTSRKGKKKRYKVIVNGSEEELFTRRTREIRDTFTDGQCFYFTINDLSMGRRGRSDLLPQTDWLDGYDQQLFGELDRAQFMRAFIWDVTLNGASESDVAKRARQIATPRPGSVRVHNEGEIWKTESPSLGAGDTETISKLVRNHILGGATIPEHWFGGAGDVNRATGEDMSGPTFKMMSMRQAYIGFMLVEVGKFVIRQWELAHNQKEPDLSDEIYAICVQWPEMVAKDTTKYATALRDVAAAIVEVVTAKLMSEKTAIAILESVAARLGVSFDAEAEIEAIKAAVPTPAPAPAPVSTKLAEAVAPADVDPSPVAAQTDLLADDARAAIDDWLTVVAQKVREAQSLPELRDNLIASYGDLNGEKLTEIMALAFAAADLAGRFDVNEGG